MASNQGTGYNGTLALGKYTHANYYYEGAMDEVRIYKRAMTDDEVYSTYAASELYESDCNDSNNEVNPGEAEICNGIDDNCDDILDGITTT